MIAGYWVFIEGQEPTYHEGSDSLGREAYDYSRLPSGSFAYDAHWKTWWKWAGSDWVRPSEENDPKHLKLTLLLLEVS